ncbi:MAG: protein-tyrosine phosphatase family protein, partial [Planctomycetota bacterium]
MKTPVRTILIAACLIFVVFLAYRWVRQETPARSVPPRPYPSTTKAKVPRPATWARKIAAPPLGNFHQVSDDFYRGAQPSQEGLKELERLGVRTVINLRRDRSDREDLVGTNLRYEEIPMTPMEPKTEDTVRFLKIISRRKDGPFFLHCLHGSDRTGAYTAIYRIVVQGWSKEAAIEEMTGGGY